MRRTGLNGLYDELNARYFAGKLPRYRVTQSRTMLSRGWCLRERHLIRVHADLSSKGQRATLLHEMCHVAAGYGHGRRFQDQLRALAQQGEKWARIEADALAQGPEYLTRNVLVDVAMQVPRPAFRDVLKWLASEYGKTPAEFRRRYPWIEQAWRNAVWEVEQLMKWQREAIRTLYES